MVGSGPSCCELAEVMETHASAMCSNALTFLQILDKSIAILGRLFTQVKLVRSQPRKASETRWVTIIVPAQGKTRARPMTVPIKLSNTSVISICFRWTRAVSQHSPVPEEHVGPSKPGERYLDTHRT